MLRELSGDPVVRTLHFHYQGPGFNPWLRNQDPASTTVEQKKNHHHLKHEVKKRVPITEILFQNISYRSGLKHNIQVTYHF